MFYSTLLIAAAAMSGLAGAQSTNETGIVGPQLDPNSVPIAQRNGWCRIQLQSCPIICGGRNENGGNECDATTLTFSCICENGMSPNTSDYEQTLPGYVCRTARDQCVANNPDDLDAQTACLNVQCGQKSLEDASSSTSSSAASSSTASSTRSSGASDAEETGSSDNDDEDSEDSASASETSTGEASSATDSAASALGLASTYGTGVLAAGILAAFGLAL